MSIRRMFILILSVLLLARCGSEWCHDEIVTVQRSAVVVNKTGQPVTARYCINEWYKTICCSNEDKRVDSNFTTLPADILPENEHKWSYLYWDSSGCNYALIVLEGDIAEIDTLFVSAMGVDDTLFWPLDSTFFRWKSDGYQRWEADSGAVVADTVFIKYADNKLSYEFH